MHPFEDRLFICGREERDSYDFRRISHFVGISNPGALPATPSWFKGAHLQLWFGDVVSEADARQCKTDAPGLNDIQQAIEFFRRAWLAKGSRILVSCDYGASRSPGLAYLFIADLLGPGKEHEAFTLTLRIRPLALPNGFVVRLGDTFLKRDGALMKPLKDQYSRINAAMPKKLL